jgi:hypothetical protein
MLNEIYLALVAAVSGSPSTSTYEIRREEYPKGTKVTDPYIIFQPKGGKIIRFLGDTDGELRQYTFSCQVITRADLEFETAANIIDDLRLVLETTDLNIGITGVSHIQTLQIGLPVQTVSKPFDQVVCNYLVEVQVAKNTDDTRTGIVEDPTAWGGTLTWGA